jgi:hypothetical protein
LRACIEQRLAPLENVASDRHLLSAKDIRMRFHRWLWTLAVAGSTLILVSGRTGAQQEKKGEQNRPPADAPGPMHKHLSVLAGSWEVATTFRMGEKEQHGSAKCEAKPIMGGRFVHQEYTSMLNGEPFTVWQIVGYDNNKRKSIEIMLDSMGTGILHNEGTISDDGKVIRNEGEHRDPQTGKTEKLRTVTTIADEDHFTLEWFMPGSNGEFERAVILKHTRRKP